MWMTIRRRGKSKVIAARLVWHKGRVSPQQSVNGLMMLPTIETLAAEYVSNLFIQSQ